MTCTKTYTQATGVGNIGKVYAKECTTYVKNIKTPIYTTIWDVEGERESTVDFMKMINKNKTCAERVEACLVGKKLVDH